MKQNMRGFMGGLVRLIAAFALAGGGALTASGAFSVEDLPSDNLVHNGGFALAGGGAGSTGGWKSLGGTLSAVPAGAGREGFALELSGQNTRAEQAVLLGSRWRTLEVRFWMRTADVVAGDESWKNARLALRFVTDSRDRVGPYPQVIGKAGTSGWTEHAQTLTVPEGATALLLEPSMFGASGTAWFADLSVRVLALDAVVSRDRLPSHNLIVNSALKLAPGQAWPSGWRRVGGDLAQVSSAVAGRAGAAFAFSGNNAKAEQSVPLSPDWWELEVRFELRTEAVAAGDADWENARLSLRFVDAAGKPVPPWPPVIGRSGTRSWEEHAQRLFVPPGAAALVVEPALLGRAGKAWFAGISVRVVQFLPVKADAANPAGGDAVSWTHAGAWKERSATRERVSLNGAWRFFPLFAEAGGELAGEGLREGAAPEAGSGWGWFKVPGIWPPWSRAQQVVLSPWVENRLQDKKLTADAISRAWYKRGMEIPDTWRGRRVLLRLEGVQGKAEVFVGGRAAGVIGWPAGELDLTALCPPGASRELAVLVSPELPAGSEFAPPTYLEKPSALRNRGLCGDAYLLAVPDAVAVGAALRETRVLTSVRRGRIDFRTSAAIHGSDAADFFLRADIFDAAGRKVKTIASGPEPVRPGEAGPDGLRELAWGGGWRAGAADGPVLWDTENPHLYTAVVSLLRRGSGAGGAPVLVDESLPVRFGFREFWIEGRDFFLNGNRVTLRGLQVRNNQGPADQASLAVCRDTIANVKNLGANIVTTHNYGFVPGDTGYTAHLYEAADELGMLVAFSLPRGEAYKWELDQPEARARYERLTRWLIESHGNHPSIVLYATNHNVMVYTGDQNPLKLDGRFEPENNVQSYMDDKNPLRRLAARRRQAFEVMDPFVRGLDPSRPIYHHADGNAGDMITLNDYLNWSPPQERAEWHARWAESGEKPLFIVEYGMPHTASWSSFRGPEFIYSVDAKQWSLDGEYAAAAFGQEAYRMTPVKVESLRWELGFLERGEAQPWDRVNRYLKRNEAAYQDVQSFYARRFLPAFRTWGVSYLPWDQQWCWIRNPDSPDTREAWREADSAGVARNGPGIQPDWRYPAWERIYDRPDGDRFLPTSIVRELERWNRPLLGYIAGGDPDVAGFTERGHNFEAGEVLKKQLILINDSPREVVCAYAWSFDAAGKRGSGNVALGPGKQIRVPVEVRLPASLAGGRHELKARFDFEGRDTQEDAFAVDVLPGAIGARGARREVVLFDPSGDSARTLARLGIPHRRVERAAGLPPAAELIARGALLVIGRGALGTGVAVPQIEAVEQGLDVLVLEQSAETLTKIGGFRVQTLRVRNAFARVPGHPALRGLDEAHLSDWRGEATLLAPYDNAQDLRVAEPKEDWCGFSQTRVWRGSNRGALATVLIEKPSIGDFRPLIDCGFNLQYSPLLEWRGRGRASGRMILCQLDVSARTAPDPAADCLLLNLVEYLGTGDDAKPRASRRLAYAGDERGRAVLELLGFEPAPWSQEKADTTSDAETVLVLAPGAPAIDGLEARVARGLRVLSLGASGRELAAQWPGRLDAVAEREIVPSWIAPEVFSAPELSGISNAEVYWRALPVLAALPAGEAGNEALQRIRIGEGAVVFSQAGPWLFSAEDKPWLRSTWRRSVFLVSRLLHNLGASAGRTGEAERLLATGDASRERPWLKTHYTQVPEKSDDPYIFYRW